MRHLRTLWLRLAGLFHKERRDREFSAELDSHLQLHIEDNLRRGMNPAEARRQALITLGGIEAAKEAHRDRRGLPFVEAFAQDIRFALRMLRKNPGFIAVVVLTLALGIGANTAVFSVVDAVLLRPLPFADPDRLMMVWEDASFMGFPQNTPAPANFVDWKKQNHVFADMAALADRTVNLTGDGEPEMQEGEAATWNVFSLLGVRPALGRTFLPEEDRPDGPKVVLLGHGLWKRRFGAGPDVVGREILINGEKHTVVGVMPPGFHFPFPYTDIWVPLGFGEKRWSERGAHFLIVVARLKPGVSLEQARADMDLVGQRLARDFPDNNSGMGALVLPIREQYAGQARSGLLILLAAVGCILLIACANVANLLLSRASARTREMVVRKALGASSSRLTRQLLTEVLLLAFLGSGLGFLFAGWSFQSLAHLIPAEFAPAVPLQLNVRVFVFTFLAAVLTALLVGLAPVLDVLRLNLNEVLKAGGARGGFSGRTRMRHVLVVAEVALTLVLLICASLLLRSLASVRGLDPGFRSEGVLTLRIVLPLNAYPDAARRAAFFDQAVEKLRGLPGVKGVAFTSALPLVWKGGTSGFAVEGRRQPADHLPYDANNRVVSPGYMQVMGMTLHSGRFFEESDGAQAQPVIIINQTMAAMYFPGQDPLGKRVKYADYSSRGPWVTIVGVVNDVKAMGIESPARPEMYFPYRQAFENWMVPRDVVIRASGDPLGLAAAARRRIWEGDPNQPVASVATLDDILDQEVRQRRVQAVLLGAFSVLALLLACVGLYGVLSFLVSQNTQEIGVRMALGAQRFTIVSRFVGRGLALAAAGMAIGMAAALALTRALESLLFGVSARDALTFSAAPAILFVVALAAAFVPARRAARVDPLVALRYE